MKIGWWKVPKNKSALKMTILMILWGPILLVAGVGLFICMIPVAICVAFKCVFNTITVWALNDNDFGEVWKEEWTSTKRHFGFPT